MCRQEGCRECVHIECEKRHAKNTKTRVRVLIQLRTHPDGGQHLSELVGCVLQLVEEGKIRRGRAGLSDPSVGRPE